MSCSDKTNYKCKSSEVRKAWLFHGTPSASEVTSESQGWGVEEEGRVKATKGPRLSHWEVSTFLSLRPRESYWRVVRKGCVTA